MIYHICPPDSLFIKAAIDRFESVKPGVNKCIILRGDQSKNSKHTIDDRFIEYYGPLNEKPIKIVNSEYCKGIVIHTLNKDILDLAISIKEGIPIFWRSWGADLHNILYDNFDPYYNYTKDLVRKMKNRSHLEDLLINKVKPIYNYILGQDRKNKELKIEFLKRVNLISTVTKSEFKELKTRVPDLKAEYIDFFYLPQNFKQVLLLHNSQSGDKIMVGHSSFAAHNHLDCFRKIENYNFGNSQILCPLSYGIPAYRERIIELGVEIFDSLFIPIVELVPLSDYQRIISNCSSFILNSKIQQGGGNILSFLMQGLKVYLPKNNFIYQDFKQLGIHIYNIENELDEDHLLNKKLNVFEQKENFRILNDSYNEDIDKESVKQIYKLFDIPI